MSKTGGLEPGTAARHLLPGQAKPAELRQQLGWYWKPCVFS